MEGNMAKLTLEAPKIVSPLAAMLIGIATTGCSTLMEPDHADAALIESNSGLSANHRYQDFSSSAKIPQRQLVATN
jgi:hypothetical protein